ncbi:prenyltransferase/squalene oxidase repeat-containing protein [Prosthecobacter fusiformis]|nr:prenyltransferase/squalene oxidase repeat-containing protein [Prosthecobacter fusiformis]
MSTFPSGILAEMRTWTNLSGQTLQAEMLGVDIASKLLRLRRADGQEFSIPIGTLNAADVAYAAERWKVMQAAGPNMSLVPALQNLPPRYASRCSDQARLARLKAHGGNEQVEEAVKRSLAWLKTQQNPDGSWGALRLTMTGHTAFVLQCFTGHCETPDSPNYGDTVMKAALYLIQKGQSDTHGILASDSKSNVGAYEHALATTALGELYVLTNKGTTVIPGLKETFQKAVQITLARQGAEGSWDYFTKQLADGEPVSQRGDLSLTHWLHQSLLVARESALPVPGLDKGIKKVVEYLESVQTKEGGFGNQNKDAHYNQWHLSGGAILGVQTLGTNSSAEASKGIRFLRDFLEKEPLDWDTRCNLYSWAGYTPAFFHAGGDHWNFYQAQWLPEMLSAQLPDGSFKLGKADWPASAAIADVYRQALSTLQLQVFYRYSNVP